MEVGGRVDLAIDRAVREMLDVEPQRGFRARVMRRIDAADSTSGKIWIFAPLAAAAILILAVLLPRSTPTSSAPAATVRVETPRPDPGPGPVERPPVVAERSPSADPAPSARPVPPRAAPRDTERVVATVAAFAAGDNATATEIAPLNAITPIHVAPIGQSSIAPEAISVRPLNAITEVQIAPLTPPDGRN